MKENHVIIIFTAALLGSCVGWCSHPMQGLRGASTTVLRQYFIFHIEGDMLVAFRIVNTSNLHSLLLSTYIINKDRASEAVTLHGLFTLFCIKT